MKNEDVMAIAVLDGGLSTALEELGVDISGPLWTARALLLSSEDLAEAHHRFALAGATYVTTASYQCGVEQFEYLGLSTAQARHTLVTSTTIAREAVRATGARVASSVGPYGASLADGSEYNGAYRSSLAAVEEYHRCKLDLLRDSNPDVFAVETQVLADEVRMIVERLEILGSPPAWFSFGFRDDETTYGGDSVQQVVDAVTDYPNLLAIGVNCTAPHLVNPILDRMSDCVPDVPLIAYPNHGGQWNARDKTWSQPAGSVFSPRRIQQWREAGVRFIGGCCGIGPTEIAELADIVRRG